MPNLAFSPGPLNPAQKQQEHGGEKENASSPPAPMSGAGISKKITGELPATGRCSVGSAGRSPLEDLSAAAPTAVAPAGGAAVVCKRDSSCKCPDCDMAASVFGINDLRQVGGGGRVPNSPDAAALSPPPASGGGLARSPLPGSSADDVAPASPVVPDATDVVGNSEDVAAQQETVVAAPADESQKADIHGETVAAAAAVAPVVAASYPAPAALPSSPPAAASVEVPSAAEEAVPTQEPPTEGGADSCVVDGQQQPAQDEGKDAEEPKSAAAVTEGGTPAPAHGSTAAAAAAENGGSKKKAGWGFRMARAVFSPLSPKVKQGDGGGDSSTVTSAFAGELDDEATAAAAPAAAPEQPSEKATAMTATAAPSAVDEIPAVPAATGDNGSASKAVEAACDDDLLSDDDLANGEEEQAQEHGPVEQEEGDAAAAAVSGGTCKPPLPGDGKNGGAAGVLEEKPAATGGPVGLDAVLGKGAASKKRSSSGRRLSKDVFFECSSEVRSANREVRRSGLGRKLTTCRQQVQVAGIP